MESEARRDEPVTLPEKVVAGSPAKRRRMKSTAIVLWLMVLLVFVPIFAAHAIALLLAEPPVENRPGPGKP